MKYNRLNKKINRLHLLFRNSTFIPILNRVYSNVIL